MKKILLPILLGTLLSTPSVNNQKAKVNVMESKSGESAITLRSSNSASVANADFTSSYEEDGVRFKVNFIDEESLVTDNTYDIGYNDNIEFLISKKTTSTSWEIGKTYHFLLSANGEIYFERAVGANSLGDRFDKSMGIVLGENLDYKITYIKSGELTTGFSAEIYLAYDLLGLTKEEALNNLTYCPAIRNTHIYNVDSTWVFYSLNGCNWSNPSTFVEI